MTYHKLGETPIMISRLGFGGGSVSGFYNEFDDNEAIETIKLAIKKGINYIDTAPYYGEGRSETLIGKALKEIPRSTYYISTKVGRYTKDWNTMFDYSAEKIKSRFNESLKLLGVDYVDIVVVHDVEFADEELILNEALPAVQSLVKEGKARYIAISGYPVKTLQQIVKQSKIKIDIVLTYSRDTLIDATLYDYISFFKTNKIGLINAAPTAMQMLTNHGPQPWHPADKETKELCAKMTEYCKDNDVELGRLAVAHTLKNEGCECVLVGFNTKSLLESNLSVLTEGLTDKEKKVLEHIERNILKQKLNLHWEGVEIKIYQKNVGKRTTS